MNTNMMQRLPTLALIAALASGCATATGTVGAPGVSPVVTRASLRATIDSMMALPHFDNAHWGILIVDPERGDTLYSRNAGKLFMPASNMKIVTGSVALASLGPDYRYRTHFATSGTLHDGMIDGDLLVIGRGDPSLSDRMREDAMTPMREIADSLASRGIRRITGDVLAWGDAFADEIWGYGWSWDDFDAPYSAGVDELIFNEGFWRVRVYGGSRPGDEVTVRTPAASLPLVEVRAVTIDSVAAPGDSVRPRTRVRLVRENDGSLVVTGRVLVGDSASATIAHRDPAGVYLAALKTALRERGIEVTGTIAEEAITEEAAGRVALVSVDSLSVRDSTGTRRIYMFSASGETISQRIDTLFTVYSPPLSEILPALEKPSQNQIAEIFLKTLGLELTGVGTADSGRAVVERQLAAWGIDESGFAIRDGSGLSRHNYLAPETVVRILDRMRQHPSFEVFYHSLPIAGVDGTIESRMRGTPAEGNLRAKTGTIDKARALSGYVTTADGRTLIFSTLANNFTVPLREVDAVSNTIGAQLAALRLGR